LHVALLQVVFTLAVYATALKGVQLKSIMPCLYYYRCVGVVQIKEFFMQHMM
jgi:hypothetical protein